MNKFPVYLEENFLCRVHKKPSMDSCLEALETNLHPHKFYLIDIRYPFMFHASLTTKILYAFLIAHMRTSDPSHLHPNDSKRIIQILKLRTGLL
jgi:hypothetical protein